MVSLEDLGINSSGPNEALYRKTTWIGHFIINHIFKGTFDFYGTENLEEDYYQLFLSDHKFYTDPIIVQMAITMASGNSNPIPAPAYKDYILHKHLGPIMAAFYSFPIYGKEDGYDNKEKSLEYCVECFLKQERLLIFPEGSISRSGKLDFGRIGSAEIALRAYNCIMKEDFETKKKKGIKIIPVSLDYHPYPGIPWKETTKLTVRFGRSIDFEKEFFNGLTYFSRLVHDEEKFKKKIQVAFMKKVMNAIGALTKINLDPLASRIIYDFAKKNHPIIKKDHLEEILYSTVDKLKQNRYLYLSEKLETEQGLKDDCERFLELCMKRKIIKQNKLYPEIFQLNYDYLLANIEEDRIWKDNLILYNCNLVEHIVPLKKIMAKELKKIRRNK